jgi:hypothetical protein
VSPADIEVFSGKNQEIEFRWAADKVLPEGTYYLVDARFTGIDEDGVCREDWEYFKWTQEEHLVVDPWLYDVICPNPNKRTIYWSVYVGQPTAGSEDLAGIRLSPGAQVWNFHWTIAVDDESPTHSGGGGIVVPNY